MRSELLQGIANIIGNYRSGELPRSLDKDHVDKWARQFSKESQEIILTETLHVLKNWYFTNDKVDEVVDRFIEFLREKYALASTNDVIASTAFLSNQAAGNSQKIILSRLSERVQERYGTILVTEPTSNTQHYVYMDDGLYTGRRAQTDLNDCLLRIPKNGQLDVLYIVASNYSTAYTKDELENALKRKNVTLSIYRWKEIQNDKIIKFTPKGGEYDTTHHCLWPTISLANMSEVAGFCDYLKSLGNKTEMFMYRDVPWLNDKGVFSSLGSRNIVEKEFLLNGIRLHQISSKTCLYPLGFNRWPSFGFGSFCAFDMNISNTCPLVLWRGSIETTGKVLDEWYPLLPRRINEKELPINSEDCFYWGKVQTTGQYHSMDQYNTCPDCGSRFGIDRDGGNGFCIDCAWKH